MRYFVLLTVASYGLVSCLSAQENPPASAASRYETRTQHDPNGIGKFYMGREIAHVMGHQAIAWLERDNREEEEKLSLLVESLKLQPGQQVADIGAGSGVISVLLAKKVGASGKVFAVDIQPEMLLALELKCKGLGITQVQPVLGKTQSPQLPAGVVDLALMVDVYHEFDFPFEMLKEIATALSPAGRVAFVEYRKEDPRVPIKEVHKMSQEQVKKEALLPELGLEWVETIDALPRQHIVIFRKKSATSPPVIVPLGN